MDVALEVLIPLAVLLLFMLAILIFLICRYFMWEKLCRKNPKYKKVSQGIGKITGYPIMPKISTPPSGLSVQQISPHQQYIQRHNTDILFFTIGKDRSYTPDFSLSPNDSDDTFTAYGSRSSKSYSFSDPDTVPGGSDPSIPKRAYSDRSYSSSVTSERSGGKHPPKLRARVRSEPSLFEASKEPLEYNGMTSKKPKKHRTKNQPPNRSNALSIVSATGGQIEFGLYYEVETRSLEITVNQLLDLSLEAESFLPLLPVYENTELPKTNKVHLIRDAEGNLELSDHSNMAFLIYVTLLPKRTYSRHTNVVFGTGNVVFNEKFLIKGYSTDQLSDFYICFHALCKLGRDGEPIVLGEVKVPLKRMQVSQLLPFMANLSPPETELEVENYLKPSTDLGYLNVYLSFNPIGQKLIVKIVQASGLPKVGMTGHPNVSIKASLYYCNTRVAKRSTVVKRRARDPVYSDTFQFDVSKDRLPECDVLFEVRHHGPMYRTIIGYVTIGNSAKDDGEKHWKALLEFSNHEKRHKIRSHKPVALL